MVFIFDLLLFSVVVTLFLTAIPKLLSMAGIYEMLGESNFGKKISSLLGSKEPTDFARGFCVVLLFVGIGYLFLNGITTDAINYKIHEPAIEAFEFCENDFTAVQVGFGQWLIKCNKKPDNLFLNLSTYG